MVKNVEKRATLDELMSHPFLATASNTTNKQPLVRLAAEAKAEVFEEEDIIEVIAFAFLSDFRETKSLFCRG